MILVSMANFAEFEGRRIGTCTKAALQAAKARGVLLGMSGPANLKRCLKDRVEAANTSALRLAGLVAGFDARKLSQRAVVAELNAFGVPAPRGGTWSLQQYQRLVKRIATLECRKNPQNGAW